MAAAYERKYYEVQKYGVASNIILAHDILIVNPAWFDSLPPDLRQAIEVAAHEAEQRSIPKSAEIPPEDIKNLQRQRDGGYGADAGAAKGHGRCDAAGGDEGISGESSPDAAKPAPARRPL